jgi:hypothetical protein
MLIVRLALQTQPQSEVEFPRRILSGEILQYSKALFHHLCISLYLTGNRPTTDIPLQRWHGGTGGMATSLAAL